MIYDGDPELRKTLERSDVANFTVEEKFQIIEAYMAGGGAAGLQIELEDDDEDKELQQMTEEEIEILNQNFAAIYERDPELQKMLPENINQLSLRQKYEILVYYQKAEENELGASGDGFMSGDDSVIVHQGKMYRRVQIEGKDEEYLIDDQQNIYDLNLNLIGVKGDSDEDDE